MALANFDPAETYYVIVGRGFAALLDHSTLPASRRGGLPILHIGHPDPWGQYYRHKMGQWTPLLTLPHFPAPQNPNDESFLGAPEFAQATGAQWNALVASGSTVAVLDEQVQSISRNSDGSYTLVAGPHNVQAAKVDICGGPGPSRRETAKVDPAATGLHAEYAGAPAQRLGWRRVVTGESFLEASTQVASGQRVIVAGDGPTSAWCVERALEEGCEVLWVGRDLAKAFVSSGRNDGLAAGPLIRERHQGRLVLRSPILPAPGSKLWLAEGYDIWRIAEDPTTSWPSIDFTPFGHRQRFVDPSGAAAGILKQETSAQVVIAIGQDTDLAEPASWAAMLHGLLTYQSAFITDSSGRKVGLCSADSEQSLRVLGSAAFRHPWFANVWNNPHEPIWQHLVSLPEQCKLESGIALCAFAICVANGGFAGGNNNLNVAPADLLKATALGPELAERWTDLRGFRVEPFTLAEFVKLAGSVRDRF